jgi:hypothetical protein
MDEEIVDEIKWTSLAGQSLIFRKSLRGNVIASTCAGGVWGDAIPKIEIAFLPDRGASRHYINSPQVLAKTNTFGVSPFIK